MSIRGIGLPTRTKSLAGLVGSGFLKSRVIEKFFPPSHRGINYRPVVLDYIPFAARFSSAKAEVPPAARSWPAFGGPETDGLSRDPDECVKHGCIDNGGG
jgi:hypothetical protein